MPVVTGRYACMEGKVAMTTKRNIAGVLGGIAAVALFLIVNPWFAVDPKSTADQIVTVIFCCASAVATVPSQHAAMAVSTRWRGVITNISSDPEEAFAISAPTGRRLLLVLRGSVMRSAIACKLGNEPTGTP